MGNIKTVGELISKLKMINPNTDIRNIEILKYEEGFIKIYINEEVNYKTKNIL